MHISEEYEIHDDILEFEDGTTLRIVSFHELFAPLYEQPQQPCNPAAPCPSAKHRWLFAKV